MAVDGGGSVWRQSVCRTMGRLLTIVALLTCRRLGQALGITIIADKIATHITKDGKPDAER